MKKIHLLLLIILIISFIINVASFDRFSFGGWDPTESLPKEGVLYVLSPNQYDGLIHKSLFEVKKIIYYPNETSAFYLISMK